MNGLVINHHDDDIVIGVVIGYFSIHQSLIDTFAININLDESNISTRMTVVQ